MTNIIEHLSAKQNLIYCLSHWVSAAVIILIAMIRFNGTYTYFKKEDLK